MSDLSSVRKYAISDLRVASVFTRSDLVANSAPHRFRKALGRAGGDSGHQAGRFKLPGEFQRVERDRVHELKPNRAKVAQSSLVRSTIG
jgi:hypothetical protein